VQPTVAITSPGQLTVSWAGTYALQSTPSLTSPTWTTVSTTSPYAITSSAQPEMFFRLISQ
jgi:hypothetical protein